MSGKPSIFRRQFLVRGGQWTYGFAFAIFSAAISVGLILAGVFLFYTPAQIPCPDGSSGCTASWISGSDLRSILLMGLGLALPSTLVSLMLGIILSHRTFGPLVRIQAFVDQLKSGDYSARLKMRSKDHLTELEGMLNGLAEVLEKKHGRKDI